MLRRRDDGFTLIELLITVVILGVIAVPLSNAIIGVLRNNGDTSDRLALSHDAQIAATYFAQDVAAMGTRDLTQSNAPVTAAVQLGASYSQGGYTCGSATTPSSVVRFVADDYDQSVSPPTRNTDVTAYYIATVGGERQLHRMKCLGPSSTPSSDIVVMHNVSASAPVVTCSPSCDAAAQSVMLSLTVVRNQSSYPITLNGQRGQQ